MTGTQNLRTYMDGERNCPFCDSPLPAHQVWPGASYRFCMKPRCKQALLSQERKGWHYVKAEERRCDNPACMNFVPEGRYANSASRGIKVCSAPCFLVCVHGKPLPLCGCGCGREVKRSTWSGSGKKAVFISREHYRKFLIESYLSEVSGVFRPIVDEYLSGFAANHFKDLHSARTSLGPFLRYLNEQKLTSLEDVKPVTITEFLASTKKAGVGTPKVSYIKTFMNWAIQMGYRESANPVINTFHNPRRKKCQPRPYTAQEIEFAWSLLEERGNPRLRLAFSIALEGGLRLGEIARLRVCDIDTVAQRCFVRLPNKTDRERYAHFAGRTVRCFADWMNKRDPSCGHDSLLHNTLGNPCTRAMLGEEFNRTLCKVFRGRIVNTTGFDKWNTHRLRHTMASDLVSAGAEIKTVMANGGWRSYEAACGYAAPNAKAARRGYDEAMRRVRDKGKGAPRTKRLSPAELLARKTQPAVPVEQSHVHQIGQQDEINSPSPGIMSVEISRTNGDGAAI